MTDAATLHRIRRGLGDADPVTRAQCADALAALDDVRGLCIALRSSDAYLRVRAVRALAHHADLRVRWHLLRAGFDADTQVRCAVAETLVPRDGWFVVRALRHLLRDEQAAVRYAALAALVGLNTGHAAALLRRVAAADPEAWLREAAVGWLRHLDAAVGRDARSPAMRNGAAARVQRAAVCRR